MSEQREQYVCGESRAAAVGNCDQRIINTGRERDRHQLVKTITKKI